MNIVVCIKRTVDTAAQVAIGPDGDIVCDGAAHIINPLDEYAIEAAVRLKEEQGGSVCAVTLGGEESVESLRIAFAMGADKLVRVDVGDVNGMDEWSVSTCVAKAIERLEADVVVMGRVSSDNTSGQVPFRVAESLGIPVLDNIVELAAADERVVVKRALPAGVERVEATFPVLIAVQKGINEPQFASFAGLMKAKKAPVATFTLDDLGLCTQAVAPKRRIVSNRLPLPKGASTIIDGDVTSAAAKLVTLLRDEAKAL